MTKFTPLFPILILLFFVELAAGQTGEAEAIETVIQRLFDGMRSADADMMRNVLHPDATLKTVQNTGELAEADMNRFLESVAGAKEGVLDEQISGLSIQTDGDLATAWMEYEFFLGDTFSHCGVNSMNLLKTATGWKIFSIVDTRRTEGCRNQVLFLNQSPNRKGAIPRIGFSRNSGVFVLNNSLY